MSESHINIPRFRSDPRLAEMLDAIDGLGRGPKGGTHEERIARVEEKLGPDGFSLDEFADLVSEAEQAQMRALNAESKSEIEHLTMTCINWLADHHRRSTLQVIEELYATILGAQGVPMDVPPLSPAEESKLKELLGEIFAEEGVAGQAEIIDLENWPVLGEEEDNGRQ